jgi:hypothetical protein
VSFDVCNLPQVGSFSPQTLALALLYPPASPAPGTTGRKTQENPMIRTIAAALAALALVSFSARAEDTKPADSTATTTTKTETTKAKKHGKKAKKASKKAAADTKADASAATK